MPGEKVLIVEDDISTRNLLMKFIAKEGFEVVEAADCRDGFEKIEREKPDIVITDFKMPQGSGLDIIRAAKKAVTGAQAILVTAFGEVDTAILALREGVIDYIKKPIDLEELASALGLAREKVAEYKKHVPFPVILIAEDDEATRVSLAKEFSKNDWKVMEAKDGEDALRVFKGTRVDVAVLDIKMPHKDGLEVLHQMRKLTSDFEAIMVTGYGDEDSVIKALKDGAINFVKKPIDIGVLELFIQESLEILRMKRILRYRSRELELVKNVLARISTAEGIVVDVIAPQENLSPAFARGLLDLIPMGLVLVDENLEIYYMNKPMCLALEGEGMKLGESCANKLKKVGIHDLPYEKLVSAVRAAFNKEGGSVETIRIGEWAYISLVKLQLVQDEKRKDIVLLAIRGERGGAAKTSS